MSEVEIVTIRTPRTITLHNGQVFSFNSNDSTTLERIPIIDVTRMYSEKLEDRKTVAEEIREASRNIGFFYMINHGIDPKYSEGVFDQSKRFFTLPEDDKMKVFTGLVPNEYVGYHPMQYYNRNNWKYQDLSEAFNWAYDALEDPEAIDKGERSVSIWPENLPGFREGLFAYHTQLLQLSRRLTKTFALALHLPEDYFDEYIKRPEAGMRILHYPEQEHSTDEQQGIGAHTDVECFTIVTQDNSGGLEVLSKSGNWIKADPVPGSFVVNIADCFMRQTNDFFVSTVHRVINKSGKERYSAPFFFGFDRKKMLEPVPTCVSEENPMKYPIMTGGEYYQWRTNKQKSSGTPVVAKTATS
ncbi:Nn.00g016370.m01.CDS01 [Neocucurbitaria sp. VM-36]